MSHSHKSQDVRGMTTGIKSFLITDLQSVWRCIIIIQMVDLERVLTLWPLSGFSNGCVLDSIFCRSTCRVIKWNVECQSCIHYGIQNRCFVPTLYDVISAAVLLRYTLKCCIWPEWSQRFFVSYSVWHVCWYNLLKVRFIFWMHVRT